MAIEMDLQEVEETELREQLFDTLTEVDPGDTLEIVADRDVDVHLLRYQIEHERALSWAYAHPDAEPRELAVTVGEALGDDALATVDVRDLKPQRRHEALLGIFEELAADEGFVLVNDHDPKPLYHELRSMHGDGIDWEYASRGSGEWHVEIVKTADSESRSGDVVTQYDVREIPKQERHPTIHHRYGMIPEGGTMELIAPHEPRPLHQEFRQRYGDSFSWEVVESEPGRCRVHITKGAGGADDASGSADSDGSASPTDGEAIEVVEELDVRQLPPARRHEQIFEAYDELETGTGFVLVNDHDPKPLYHQFDAEAGAEFRWEYRQREPDEFRVLIGKADTKTGDATSGEPEAPF
ncbi:DUF2249 domain-containing protein [Haloarchaeobius litoreus]|uniref:DUF2249 domain-containing protein n=1 Tax=Haloarchaeobius litoreus TaxID=755306 RepID=A0ABD6DQU0_9EURY|nr:DUF2249 domain-containing protein [Haloarchaeobius litoreus]